MSRIDRMNNDDPVELGALRCLMTSYFTNLVGALMLMGLMVGGGVFIGREAFVIE